jgi:hypothetical protein
VAGKVLTLSNVITPDTLACHVANKYVEWNTLRQTRVNDWKELRQYVYQTDTTQTSNVTLPWKNKTTVPKLCQIRDNLYANYMASMFPKRKWLKWEGGDRRSDSRNKRAAIENYMNWVKDRPEFKDEISKLVLDYIDYGNCFVMPDWVDQRVSLDDKMQVGFVGPVPRRINPNDIVFNPIAPTFKESPKIIRSLMSMGEVKELLARFSTDENKAAYDELYQYLKDLRNSTEGYTDDLKDSYFQMDGFDSFRAYLDSGYCEILTFYGDLYDDETDEFLKNHEIIVVDRHKLIIKRPNPSFFGFTPIFHCGWRVRQDNLWAMGPLDNLIGLQYRIDHLENLKADLLDLTAFPPLKVRGYVEDFNWGPFERIHIGDDGDVEILSPDVQALNVNLEIQMLEQKMEEMAGAPKEAMGFRTPGEKTMYEIQRLENAASRVFTNKIAHFEEQVTEQCLNGMLELARRQMDSTMIRVFDDEFQVAHFQTLTPMDITGSGRIRPVAARHFAEKAERVQNINAFTASAAYADPAVNQHMSGIELARLFGELLDLDDYNIVEPFIRLTEAADAQRLMQVHEENVAMEAGTPTGMTPDDADPMGI